MGPKKQAVRLKVEKREAQSEAEFGHRSRGRAGPWDWGILHAGP